MNLFLDCEFNGFGGELISMALVDENGGFFYETLPCLEPKLWVKNNVIPVLEKKTIDSKKFHNILFNFLNDYNEIHIVADWPEDLALFLKSLLLNPGTCMMTPKLTMEIWNSDINAFGESKIPHNALQDAIALKKRYLTFK